MFSYLSVASEFEQVPCRCILDFSRCSTWQSLASSDRGFLCLSCCCHAATYKIRPDPPLGRFRHRIPAAEANTHAQQFDGPVPNMPLFCQLVNRLVQLLLSQAIGFHSRSVLTLSRQGTYLTWRIIAHRSKGPHSQTYLMSMFYDYDTG